jgi:2-polyprenyl-3-methyl-5-hydroxy-6-metoxy-1,4-benzoquinol methylase
MSMPASSYPVAMPPRPGDDDLDRLSKLYAHRFSEADAQRKDAIWRVITAHLQRYVDRRRPVLDIGCDRGNFIRNISADEKWATDLRDVGAGLGSGIKFVQCNGLDIAQALPNGYFGTVFMSNYLEHLATADAVLDQLVASFAVTGQGGRVVILQPNIRLVREAYWDFLDHRVAMTEKNLREACETVGYRSEHIVVRFLPYTTKSRLPQSESLVRAYLRFPPARWLLGQQTLYVGVKE